MQQGKTDQALGYKVRAHLIQLGLDSDSSPVPETAWNHLREGIRLFLSYMVGDPRASPSTEQTPDRVADMYVKDLCWGLDYSLFPKCTTFPNGELRPSKELIQKALQGARPGELIRQPPQHTVGKYDQMVRLVDISTISLCEHHFQTIYGRAHIAYIPSGLTIGISKLARVNEFFSRRPQIQERITEQVFAALVFILKTDDVAVVHDCAHYCMRARGSMQAETIMRTDKMGGRFMSNPSLRQEFFHGIG